MQIYDIVMLAVLGLAIVRGYAKGLAWQLAWIASIGVSYVVAYRYRDPVAAQLDVPDPWRGVVAMLILYIVSSIVIWLLFQSVKGALEKAKLKDFDKQMGAIFGAIKGAALCTVITLFSVCLLQPQMTQAIVNSKSGGYIARVLHRSETLMPDELHQVLEPYLRKAEDRLNDRNPTPSEPGGFPEDLLPEIGDLLPDNRFGASGERTFGEPKSQNPDPRYRRWEQELPDEQLRANQSPDRGAYR